MHLAAFCFLRFCFLGRTWIPPCFSEATATSLISAVLFFFVCICFEDHLFFGHASELFHVHARMCTRFVYFEMNIHRYLRFLWMEKFGFFSEGTLLPKTYVCATDMKFINSNMGRISSVTCPFGGCNNASLLTVLTAQKHVSAQF